MNKKKTINCNLKNITIDYTRRSYSNPAQKHSVRSQHKYYGEDPRKYNEPKIIEYKKSGDTSRAEQ